MAGALLLLGSLYLGWWSALAGKDARLDAWEALNKVEVTLTGLAALTLLAASLRPSPRLAGLRALAGGAAGLLVAWKLGSPPVLADSPLAGPFVALAAAGAIAAGGVLDLLRPPAPRPPRRPSGRSTSTRAPRSARLASFGRPGWSRCARSPR